MMVGSTGLQVLSEPGALTVPVLMAALVAALLYTVGVSVSRGVILALVPWMVVGGAAHAIYTVDAFDEWVEIFFGPIAVYFTTFVLAGIAWSMMSVAAEIAGEQRRDAQYLTAAGTGAALIVGGVALTAGDGASSSQIYPTFGGMLVALVVAGVGYLLLSIVYSKGIVQTDVLGYFVVAGQTLDAVMAAVSVEYFHLPPSTTFDARVLSVAGSLPTADTLGAGWLLIVVKLSLGLAVVSLVGYLLTVDLLGERPEPAYLCLGLGAAVGIGPGLHRFFSLLIGV